MDAMIAEGKIHARNIVPATQPLVENTFDHKQNPPWATPKEPKP